ncbi:hypothetical protein PR202_gb21246 [Eleusine coracana subsp. coracana]|uniref:Uncharacterized protein n=1 Tax=Eleusine coracana subsp. coracana TaxID=191504 RepID=A0AAV5FDG6_ELECO|nr:hypothetical protein QOZ80_7BG0603910 [Eleusine coracana subsp. coracana]GJN32723.1 hypothetical protein PR202_gb21246 [Eleusine coracana subsp. coracana]
MAPRLLSCFGRRGTGATASAPEDGSDQQQAVAPPGPVLVELFSSQGCGASPEADAVAARLAQESGAGEVVVLGFHVDYWDYRGWKDPFASSAWTVRQKAYVEALRLDTLLTPQAVVQGRAHCVGTDQDALAAAVRHATRYPAPAMKVTFQRPNPTTLQASFTGTLRSKVEGPGGASVVVALYESGLVTDCGRGENKGKSLLNDHVVRRLEKVAALREGAAAKKTVSGTVQFPLWDGFRATKCGIVLFVQNAALQVLGVQHFDLPDNV